MTGVQDVTGRPRPERLGHVFRHVLLAINVAITSTISVLFAGVWSSSLVSLLLEM